ncbi:NAD(P)H-dependent oxidoreductase [Volucribacter amazonae]|uniref:NADPH quinone reductase MdaB n=1 Tax=Volucribacter amazonae TaxID=256731 RepID=A0A9X4PRF3_9PAST|nr:NAD(P)H-dependent oxidoreductase [Volucribacter amazonae]MDG6896273.1 NADPH quinone reductase MdaB [Volucribacter amazonae]
MNILLLNGAKAFAHSQGKLNQSLQQQASQFLSEQGHQLHETLIDQGYHIEQEVQNWLWADVVIWQMPAWWMGEPWIVKKYIDEVFTAGHNKFYHSDGRHRSNPTEGYGTGGLLQGKKYMLSLTWNAPIEAFNRPNEFFAGQGVDGVYLHFHKAHEFLGMTALPTFICNDVIKNPQVEQYLQDYRQHLSQLFA